LKVHLWKLAQLVQVILIMMQHAFAQFNGGFIAAARANEYRNQLMPGGPGRSVSHAGDLLRPMILY